MTDKLRFGGNVQELKLGASFTNKASSFHTLKCNVCFIIVPIMYQNITLFVSNCRRFQASVRRRQQNGHGGRRRQQPGDGDSPTFRSESESGKINRIHPQLIIDRSYMF